MKAVLLLTRDREVHAPSSACGECAWVKTWTDNGRALVGYCPLAASWRAKGNACTVEARINQAGRV